MSFCRKKIEDGNQWGHKLTSCSGVIPLCCKVYWCPCWVFGEVARSVEEPCCPCCFFMSLGFVGCWAGMRVRGRMRERHNINGTWQKDLLMSYCCGFCSILQMAQEAMDHEEFKMGKKSEDTENERETTFEDNDDMYY